MMKHQQKVRAQFIRLYGTLPRTGTTMAHHSQWREDKKWLLGFSNLVAAKLRRRQEQTCPLPPGVVPDATRRANAERIEAWAHRYNHHRRTGEVPALPIYRAPAIRGRHLRMSEV